MISRLRTYTNYSVGCFVVWGVILIARSAAGGPMRTILTVFGGWVIGWASASIARVVYPAPRSWARQNRETEREHPR